MSKKYYLLVALIVVAGIVVASFTVQKSSVVPEKTPVTLTGEETTEIKWYSVNEALALHEKTGKSCSLMSIPTGVAPVNGWIRTPFTIRHHGSAGEVLHTGQIQC